MFQIGELIMYGNNGVCKVMDICTLPHSKDDNELYYRLEPFFDGRSKIYIPVNNEKVFMRKIYTRQEVEHLIKAMADIEPYWIDDRKEREVKFKEALRAHDSKECISMLKGLYMEKQSKIADGKKLNESDGSIFSNAEKQIFGEFAVALEIPVDEVTAYIGNFMAENTLMVQ